MTQRISSGGSQLVTRFRSRRTFTQIIAVLFMLDLGGMVSVGARQEVTVTSVKLSLLDALAARSADPAGRSDFVDALLNYVGADEVNGKLRPNLRQKLIAGETAWSVDKRSSVGSEEFLSSVQDVVGELHIQSVFNLSESDLFLARKSLAKVMPHFFSDPSEGKGLRPAERLFLMRLIWLNGTLAKEEGLPTSQVSYTTVIFSNGRRSQYLGLRNSSLDQMPEATLQHAFNELIDLLARH